jgi:hypothetical protein
MPCLRTAQLQISPSVRPLCSEMTDFATSFRFHLPRDGKRIYAVQRRAGGGQGLSGSNETRWLSSCSHSRQPSRWSDTGVRGGATLASNFDAEFRHLVVVTALAAQQTHPICAEKKCGSREEPQIRSGCLSERPSRSLPPSRSCRDAATL